MFQWQSLNTVYECNISWEAWCSMSPKLQEYMRDSQKELKEMKLKAIEKVREETKLQNAKK